MFRFIFSCSLALLALTSFSGCSSTSSGEGDGEGISESELDAMREGRFGSGNIPTAEGGGMFRDIFFDYDSARLSPEARMDLEFNVKVLQDNPNLKIIIEGHCDERGTAEYNMALGAERARSVRQALVSMGVSSTKLDTISYGEEVPMDPGHGEESWAKNRRAHLSPHSN